MPLLVVGVKTSVVFGFAYRQAIRETLANKTSLLTGVQVVFIGCQPNSSLMTPLIREAIELEKERFGDLPTQAGLRGSIQSTGKKGHRVFQVHPFQP